MRNCCCGGFLVLLGGVGEVGGFHVVDVAAYGAVDYCRQVGVATQEFGRESLVDAEHVVHHEHLAVDSTAGTDADNGDCEFRRHAGSERCRYLFENYGETAYFFEQMRVGKEFFGFGFFFGTHCVCAELVD